MKAEVQRTERRIFEVDDAHVLFNFKLSCWLLYPSSDLFAKPLHFLIHTCYSLSPLPFPYLTHLTQHRLLFWYLDSGQVTTTVILYTYLFLNWIFVLLKFTNSRLPDQAVVIFHIDTDGSLLSSSLCYWIRLILGNNHASPLLLLQLLQKN